MSRFTGTVFDLKKKQQLAFNRLKKAFKDCEKAGVFFFNDYGKLCAADNELVDGFGDNSSGFDENQCIIGSSHNFQYLEIPGEWSDDNHWIHMTAKGAAINTYY